MKPLIVPLRVATGLEPGTPLLAVLHTEGISISDMQEIIENHGLEAGFLFPALTGSDYDYEVRFWSSLGEQKRSDHLIIGAVWLMARLGMLARNNLRIVTKGDTVDAAVTKTSDRDNPNDGIRVEVSQPTCTVMEPLGKQHINSILYTLGLEKHDLIPGMEIQNVATSRVKTLIPIRPTEKSNSLVAEYPRIKKLCEKIGSTGLYLYAVIDETRQEYTARQLARNIEYREDAVNGVAASALCFALLVRGYIYHIGQAVKIKQSSATDCPFEVSVRFRTWSNDVVGYWIGGTADFAHFPQSAGRISAGLTETEMDDCETATAL